MRTLFAATALTLLLAAPAQAGNWTVDAARSTITFTASQSGEAFSGTLPAFSADITFDENDLAQAHVNVAMPLAGVSTGSATRDADLPGPVWLDVAQHPQATFESRSFRATGAHSYVAEGTLTIRGVSQPLLLPFDLTLEDGTALATSTVRFSRMPFGIGKDWPESSGVSETVTVKIVLYASREQAAGETTVPAGEQPISLPPEAAPVQ